MSKQDNNNRPAPPPGPVGGRGPGGPGGPGRLGMPKEKPKNTINTLKRIWVYLRRHTLTLIIIAIIILLTTVLGLWGPLLIGKAIDDHILLGDFPGLVIVLLQLAGIYLVSAVLSYFQQIVMIRISQTTVGEMRKDLFTKIQKLPLKFFDTRPHGEIMSRVTNDIDNVSNMLNQSISQVISGIITIIGSFVFMLMISPILTVVSFVSIPLILLITRAVTKRSSVFFKQNQKILGELNSKIEEIISGQRVVKVFVREKEEIKQFDQLNQDLNKVGTDAQIYSGSMGPLMNGSNNIGFTLLIVCGGILVFFGKLQIGMITSFTLYQRNFTRPINEIANQFNTMLSAVAGAERVFEIIDEPTEPEDAKNAVVLDNVTGHVELQNVFFSYKPEVPVLKNISITAESGKTIALVGPTGAGKTTIINLLTRFYDIDSGTVTIDGYDIKNTTMDSLRKSLGIVLQDTYLFAGTIKENLRYGNLNATDAQIIEAAKLANAHEFIRRLPQRYDTELTENADNLSHGQKQMLAIARTILANPSILVLDEATSNVDTRTEQKIQQAMANLMEGRTCFVIAHRLSTIKNADTIAVIDKGEIIERGNHKELLKRKGFYHNLYMSQFSD